MSFIPNCRSLSCTNCLKLHYKACSHVKGIADLYQCCILILLLLLQSRKLSLVLTLLLLHLVSARTEYSTTDFLEWCWALYLLHCMIPWILTAGFSCCCNTEMLFYANNAASIAFMASHRNAAARAAFRAGRLNQLWVHCFWTLWCWCDSRCCRFLNSIERWRRNQGWTLTLNVWYACVA